MEDWDPLAQVERMIARCNGKLKFYQEVYKLIGKEFSYRHPTEAELELYVQKLGEIYRKKPPKGGVDK